MARISKLLTKVALGTLAGAAVLLLSLWAAWAWLLPAPPSPPLADRSGIVLDEEAAARLTEVVFQAAREDDATTIEAYLRAGFTPEVRSVRGDTLLTVAAYHGSEAATRALLAAPRIDVDARNRMGLTALAAASFKGHAPLVRALLARGADPNARSATGQTALMFASLTGRAEAVRLLLEAGADPSAADALGNTAASLARLQGADDALRALEAQARPRAATATAADPVTSSATARAP